MTMQIREAMEEVEIAFRQLEFAIKLLSFCELSKINPAEFDTDHLVTLKSGNLHFPSGNFQDNDSLIKAAGTSVLIAFSATVLVLDQTFDAIGIKVDPGASDDAGQLRVLVYMVRCAHAHRMADPRWEVRGRYARALMINLDGEMLSLDLRSLHGQPFDIDELGGYDNWYRIRNAASRLFSIACAA